MPQVPPAGYVPAPQPSSAPFVLGIVSIVCAFLFWPAGLVCGIIAIVMAGRQIKQFGPVIAQKAKTGRICGIVGTVISALSLVLVIVAVAITGSVINEAYEQSTSVSEYPTSGSTATGVDDEAAAADVEAAFDVDINTIVSAGNQQFLDAIQELMDSVDNSSGSDPDALTFSAMGLTAQEIADAMLAGASYSVDDVSVYDDVAYVDATLYVPTINGQMEEFANLASDPANADLIASDPMKAAHDLYLKAFETTEPSEVAVFVSYDLKNGQWTLPSDDAAYIVDEVCYAL